MTALRMSERMGTMSSSMAVIFMGLLLVELERSAYQKNFITWGRG